MATTIKVKRIIFGHNTDVVTVEFEGRYRMRFYPQFADEQRNSASYLRLVVLDAGQNSHERVRLHPDRNNSRPRDEVGFVIMVKGWNLQRFTRHWRAALKHVDANRSKLPGVWHVMNMGRRDLIQTEQGKYPPPTKPTSHILDPEERAIGTWRHGRQGKKD